MERLSLILSLDNISSQIAAPSLWSVLETTAKTCKRRQGLARQPSHATNAHPSPSRDIPAGRFFLSLSLRQMVWKPWRSNSPSIRFLARMR